MTQRVEPGIPALQTYTISQHATEAFMKYTQTQPCPQCPYTGKLPGFIGGHEDPQDFHDAVVADTPFPCHMSVNACKVSIAESIRPGSRVQHCVGYMLYMNRMCKVSRRPEVAQRQAELKPINHLVLDPFKKEVVTVHRDAINSFCTKV